MVDNNIIVRNASTFDGGGIFLHYQHQGYPIITNNTLANNTANVGGGGIHSRHSSNPIIRNTILCGNVPVDFGFDAEGTATFTFSDVCNPPQPQPGEGNISTDPLFRNSPNDDYHLQSITNPDCGDPDDSPCIDAGDPSICDLILDCDHGLGEIGSEIPTLSEWGMLIMGLLLLAAGTVAVVRRKKVKVAIK